MSTANLTDPTRVAALGRRYSDDLAILRGAINAAILTRPAGALSAVVDVEGIDLGTLSLLGPGGYPIGPRGEVWKVTGRTDSTLTVAYDALETRAMFGVEPAVAVAIAEAA